MSLSGWCNDLLRIRCTYSFDREVVHGPGHLVRKRRQVPRRQVAAGAVQVAVVVLRSRFTQKRLQLSAVDPFHDDEDGICFEKTRKWIWVRRWGEFLDGHSWPSSDVNGCHLEAWLDEISITGLHLASHTAANWTHTYPSSPSSYTTWPTDWTGYWPVLTSISNSENVGWRRAIGRFLSYLYPCSSPEVWRCWGEVLTFSLLAVPSAALVALCLRPILSASWRPRRTHLRFLEEIRWRRNINRLFAIFFVSEASIEAGVSADAHLRYWEPRISTPDRNSLRPKCWWRAGDDAEIPSRRPFCFDFSARRGQQGKTF